MSKPIYIGHRPFPSKRDAADHIRSMLHGYPVGATVSPAHAAILADLLDGHPNRDAKVGCGIRSFQVEWNMGSPGFWVTRVDGTRTDFSYVKCLTPPSQASEVKSAFRDAVRDQIADFRRRSFAASATITCPFTGESLTSRDCHVDHHPPFDELVGSFLRINGISISMVVVAPSLDGQMVRQLADMNLSHRWCQFHAAHAGLRVVSATANLSILRRRNPTQSGE